MGVGTHGGGDPWRWGPTGVGTHGGYWHLRGGVKAAWPLSVIQASRYTAHALLEQICGCTHLASAYRPRGIICSFARGYFHGNMMRSLSTPPEMELQIRLRCPIKGNVLIPRKIATTHLPREPRGTSPAYQWGSGGLGGGGGGGGAPHQFDNADRPGAEINS